jgi:lysozyme family protein
MTLKQNIINGIIKVEGGYVNDSSDSGGETNHGITIKVARDYGFMGNMRELSIDTAYLIYEKNFWNKLLLDDIVGMSELIAEEVADTGVNMGINRASTFLQRSLTVLNNKGTLFNDLTPDGHIGGKTLNALASYLNHRGKGGEKVLHKMLNCLQGAFYIELAERREKDEKYILGWFKNRVN